MTIQSRHRAVSSALTIAALLAGSACGGTAHRAVAPTPITISFLSYNYGTPDLGGRGTQHLIDAFEAVYPAIRIAPMGVATKDVLTTLRADEAAGHAPDVAQSKMAEACASLPIAPIQDIPSEQDWSVHVEDMSPPADGCRQPERSGEGHALHRFDAHHVLQRRPVPPGWSGPNPGRLSPRPTYRRRAPERAGRTRRSRVEWHFPGRYMSRAGPCRRPRRAGRGRAPVVRSGHRPPRRAGRQAVLCGLASTDLRIRLPRGGLPGRGEFGVADRRAGLARAGLPYRVSHAVSCLIGGGTVSLNPARSNDRMRPVRPPTQVTRDLDPRGDDIRGLGEQHAALWWTDGVDQTVPSHLRLRRT